MTGARLAAAVLLMAMLSLVPLAPASAAPIFEEADAVELANSLAEAQADQDVCYGWLVTVQDDGGSSSGIDRGSSLGPDRDPREAACEPSVIFVADLHYTAETSEAPDGASYRIESSLSGFQTQLAVSALGVSESGLLGDNDDLVVRNATALLPGLVAEQGLAPPILAEETTGTIPATDRPTGRPSSDLVRTYWPAYTVAGLLAAAGVVWLATALFLRSAQRQDPDFTLSSMLQDD